TRRGVPFRVTGAARFAARPAVRVLLDRLREADRTAPQRPFTEHLGDLAADVDEEPDLDAPDAGVSTPPPSSGGASADELRTHRARPAGHAPAVAVARRARTRGRQHTRRAGRSQGATRSSNRDPAANDTTGTDQSRPASQAVTRRPRAAA